MTTAAAASITNGDVLPTWSAVVTTSKPASSAHLAASTGLPGGLLPGGPGGSSSPRLTPNRSLVPSSPSPSVMA